MCTTTLQDGSTCDRPDAERLTGEPISCFDCGEPVCRAHYVSMLPNIPSLHEIHFLIAYRTVSLCITCHTAREIDAIADHLRAVRADIKQGDIGTGVPELHDVIRELNDAANCLSDSTNPAVTAFPNDIPNNALSA